MAGLFVAALPATAAQPRENANTATASAAFDANLVARTALPTAPAPAANAIDLSHIDPPVDASPVATSIGGGVASYYGRRFHGRRTANGERFDMHAMTAAHRTLPFGSLVRVTSSRTGKSVVVRINDRGPFHGNRVIDLSTAAARTIGLIRSGTGRVNLALMLD